MSAGEDERCPDGTFVAKSLAWGLEGDERYSNGTFVARGLAWVEGARVNGMVLERPA